MGSCRLLSKHTERCSSYFLAIVSSPFFSLIHHDFINFPFRRRNDELHHPKVYKYAYMYDCVQVACWKVALQSSVFISLYEVTLGNRFCPSVHQSVCLSVHLSVSLSTEKCWDIPIYRVRHLQSTKNWYCLASPWLHLWMSLYIVFWVFVYVFPLQTIIVHYTQ